MCVLAAEIEALDYDHVVAAVLQALQQLETPPALEIRGDLPVNENTRRLLEVYQPRISFGGS